MQSTTLRMPPELKQRVLRAARESGLSLSEYVRRAIEDSLQNQRRQRKNSKPDGLFLDTAIYRGEAPSDLAKKHDAYLYD